MQNAQKAPDGCEKKTTGKDSIKALYCCSGKKIADPVEVIARERTRHTNEHLGLASSMTVRRRNKCWGRG